jgi:hypothetical protein
MISQLRARAIADLVASKDAKHRRVVEVLPIINDAEVELGVLAAPFYFDLPGLERAIKAEENLVRLGLFLKSPHLPISMGHLPGKCFSDKWTGIRSGLESGRAAIFMTALIDFSTSAAPISLQRPKH